MVKLKLKEVPQFEQKERYALERMRSLSINGKKSILSRLSNEEVSALGSLTAKYHLSRILEYINSSGCNKFEVDFFCNVLRIFKENDNKPTLCFENHGMAEVTLFRAYYGKIIDDFFGVPLVEEAYPPFSKRYCFEIER
ncbi:MAG: hypothetical protein J6C46_01585 [Clostridia bacterium]|nr:hypothetical protein [Clostridia bacterium]